MARFKATYEDRIEPIPDRSQWPVVELGFKVFPPLLGRGAGKPKVQRQRGCLEKMASKKKVKCRRCGDFGHFSKLAKRQRLEKMVRELHQGTRLTKGMFLCTKSVSLFFTSQYVMSPLKCRKQAPINAVGPSQGKK